MKDNKLFWTVYDILVGAHDEINLLLKGSLDSEPELKDCRKFMRKCLADVHKIIQKMQSFEGTDDKPDFKKLSVKS